MNDPGWLQIGYLGLALTLSALIGLEREMRAKSAGLRTHTIVGLGAALFMLISKYGFADVVVPGVVTLDPSRVAAQIVSGIGFIGAGLIFVRRDAVRGLTTAATVWLTAAVGAAAGAGLPVLATLATVGHFVIVYGLTAVSARLPRSKSAPTQIRLSYLDGSGLLRQALVEAGRRGFAVAEVSVEYSSERAVPDTGRDDQRDRRSYDDELPAPREVSVVLEVIGTGTVADLVAAIAELPGLVIITAGDVNEASE